MAGMLCTNCRELTLHRTPTGAECSNCGLVVKTKANGGKGGRGLKCPMCKEHTVFRTDAYFGLSGHLFRFHPARRFGVIRPA